MDVNRYAEREKLELDVEFVTPAFLGGPNSKKAELRPAPFKGTLRFWWRAIYGAQYGKKILEVENEIFGSATTDKSHASRVRLLVQNTPSEKDSRDLIKNPNSTLSYLAYGKGSTRQEPNFSTYLDMGAPFRISVSFSAQLSEEQVNQVKNALLALMEFGGIGGKCHNGYGCMKMITPIRMGKLHLSYDAQEFPSLSKQSRFFSTKKTYSTWSEALGAIGLFYKECKQAKAMKLGRQPGEKRHSKEMFLHITQNSDKRFQGHFLTMPQPDSNFAQFYKMLEDSNDYEEITHTVFEV